MFSRHFGHLRLNLNYISKVTNSKMFILFLTRGLWHFETKAKREDIFFFFCSLEMNSTWLITSELANLNLLDILTVNNVYQFQILKFTHLWHKGLLPSSFSTYFRYASSIHSYNTRYSSRQNLYVKKVRTNAGKQTIQYGASVVWDRIPKNLKELNVF